MREYRITKYDPALRDEDGIFLGDDWTAFSDVNSKDRASSPTLEDYEIVESAYLQTAVEFIVESGGESLLAVDIENVANNELGFDFTAPIAGHILMTAMRNVMRERYWARFVDESGRFVHFGWDMYMYVGVPRECPVAKGAASKRGLFVEAFRSPYHELDHG